ncbi:unnamed protein product [Cyprideis torosa]|uniref:Uncharacterized protein n=1 Tax=Cyprideis torosa TaxID=163714 RepID=A0A7R8WLJ7_9CRUS|nr:unnamed protein product [Cyprideis torosa]CAG0897365.1 unnamed protein product [Cyprideis torosa]
MPSPDGFFNLATLKKHPPLIPLVFFIGGGVTLAGFYILRLATRNPDVSWTRKELSNETYRDKQYKFFRYNKDLECKAPKYWEENCTLTWEGICRFADIYQDKYTRKTLEDGLTSRGPVSPRSPWPAMAPAAMKVMVAAILIAASLSSPMSSKPDI